MGSVAFGAWMGSYLLGNGFLISIFLILIFDLEGGDG